MISSRLKNDLSKKRWNKFKKNRSALASIFVLIVLFFFSFTAELWCNSKPIVIKHQGQLYYPFVFDYHPTVFGVTSEVVTNYRALPLGPSDWALWPIVKWDPFESNSNVDFYPSKPSEANWIGTDDRGRDVLARLLYGFRYTMLYAIGVWLISYTVGTLIGAGLGYFSGKWDLFGSRAVEIIEMMPKTLLLITIISIFSPNLFWLILFTVVFDWTGIFHQMRAQFLQLRKREFVEAARALGVGHLRILLTHILPNALTPLVTFSPFAIAANIYGLTVLDYLGLGLPAPTPSWGELISQSQKYITTAEWLVWAPAIAIVITMTSLINIGIAIRDAFDSRG